MSWQKCPKCNGYGETYEKLTTPTHCFICNGFGVINSETGMPLYTVTTTTNVMINEPKPGQTVCAHGNNEPMTCGECNEKQI